MNNLLSVGLIVPYIIVLVYSLLIQIKMTISVNTCVADAQPLQLPLLYGIVYVQT